MKKHWEAFNEAHAIVAVILVLMAAVTYFAGKFDYVSVLEYWTLTLVCVVSAIYIARHHNNKVSNSLLIWLCLAAITFIGLIVYRQDLRYNDYDASWDIAYSNTLTEHGSQGLQIGICVLNPNNFPIHVRIPAISASIDKSSGSYANNDPDRIITVGRFSANSMQFSDAMPIGLADSGPHETVLQATIEYGRDKEELDKQMNIRAKLTWLQDLMTNEVLGGQIDPTTGTPPNSYDLVERLRESKCRRISR